MGIRIDVQVALEDDDLPGVPRLRRFARAALSGRRESAEMTVRVVGEDEGRDLNESYRRRDGATNVLAFPFDAPPAGELELDLLGDVVVCAPVARREALERGRTLEAHLAHLVVHGTLHLLGYDHRRAPEARRMEEEERRVLAGLGFADPYAEEPAA